MPPKAAGFRRKARNTRSSRARNTKDEAPPLSMTRTILVHVCALAVYGMTSFTPVSTGHQTSASPLQ